MTPTPTRGVPIQLDRERHLRFSLKTMREMRTEFGDKVLEVGLSQDAIARMLWYGLRHEDPELTVAQVEEMVDLEHLTEVMAAVSKATGQRGSLEKAKPDPQPPAAEQPEEEPAPLPDAGDDESGSAKTAT